MWSAWELGKKRPQVKAMSLHAALGSHHRNEDQSPLAWVLTLWCCFYAPRQPPCPRCSPSHREQSSDLSYVSPFVSSQTLGVGQRE